MVRASGVGPMIKQVISGRTALVTEGLVPRGVDHEGDTVNVGGQEDVELLTPGAAACGAVLEGAPGKGASLGEAMPVGRRTSQEDLAD